MAQAPSENNRGASSDEGARAAAEIVAQVETGPREPADWLPNALIIGLCLAWSLFQLYHAEYPFTAKVARYIHLSFALALTYLAYPALKGHSGQRHRRVANHLGVALLLLVPAVLIWANLGAIIAGVSDDRRFWGVVAPILVYLLTIGMTIEGLRRLAAGLFRLFNPTAGEDGSGALARLLGLGMARSARRVIPVYDYLFALVAASCVLYLIYDFDKIVESGGLIDQTQQLIFGVILILLLLEAARRSLGLPLTILGVVFLVYALWPALALGRGIGVPWLDAVFGWFLPTLPDFINPPPQPLSQVVGEMYLTDTSIFGVPIDVSVSFVFLFVLFGGLLDKAGAGKYFIDVAFAGLGSQRAGPAKAAIIASGATGLVSGSSIANTVTTGTFTIPLMKQVGLPPYKAGAVEVAASTNGQLMPPVMGAAAFIMAEIIGVKYIDVVRAAFMPAVISYLALFYVVHLEALKLGIKKIPKGELPPLLKTFVRGMHYLVPIAVLVYFLIVLRRSAIESAELAIFALLVLMVIQRPIIGYLGLGAQRRAGTLDPAVRLGAVLASAFLTGLRDIWDGLIAGARNMISVGVATATAGIIVGVVSITGLTGRFVGIITTLSFGNIVLVLILTAISSVILGMGVPTTATYIIMASLTAPVILHIAEVQQLVIPILAAHLFVFYFGILADDTPPVGLAAYAAAAIARADPIRTGVQGFTYDLRTAILPFVFVFNNELLMIADTTKGGAPIWIDNVFLIVFVFAMALAGMCAFAAFLQGYLVERCTIVERLGLLLAATLMFVPAILLHAIGADPDADFARRIIQIAGLALVGCLYALQRARIRRRETHEAQAA